MKCVRFLVDHCEPMVKDNSDLFKTTISTLMKPMISHPPCHSTDNEEASIDSSSILSQDELTCNGGGVDNQPSKAGVARAVKPGSGQPHSSSAGNMKTCNRRLLLVQGNVDGGETDALDMKSVECDFPLTIQTVFTEQSLNHLISKLVSIARKINFKGQCLVCLFQDQQKIPNSSKNRSNPSLLKFILAIQRNEYGQIYVVHGLERSLHFTISTSDFGELVSQSYPRLDENDQEVSSSQMNHLMVPNTSNYVSPDRKTIVLNANATKNHHQCGQLEEQKAISYCRWLMTQMFESGMSECFSYIEKGRSGLSNADELVDGSCAVSIVSIAESCSVKTMDSKSSKRRTRKSKKKKRAVKKNIVNSSALPTITCGWSTNDANQYKFNRSSIANTVKPFLRDGGLPKDVKKLLLEVVQVVLGCLPEGSFCFDFDIENDLLIAKFRKGMASKFEKMLGGRGDSVLFRVEGITILIPLSIAAHRDLLNCFIEGMTSVIQINARIPLNKKTIKGGRTSLLWKWLELNGYSTWFPCSIILYARKVVYDYCKKLSEMSKFLMRDPLRKCIKWAVMDRINTTVDYIGNIWFNQDFQNKFMSTATVVKGSRFKGNMLQLTAAYDKTCYYSIIAHVFFNLNVNFIQFTVGDALDFIAYCGFRCNGTVLIAEIHRRIMKDTERYDALHSDCGSMYQFLIKVNQEITSCSPGSCTQNRFNFSQGISSTSWNTKRQELLNLCKQFYAKEETLTRQDSIYKTAQGVLETLVKAGGNFHGVGGMGSNHFLHLSALFGLIPLACYNYAEVKKPKSGPAKLITAAFPQITKISDINECFLKVHSELKKIWGPQITLALIGATEGRKENFLL